MKKKVFMFLLSLTMCSSVLPQVSVFANQISNTEEYTSDVNNVILQQIQDIESVLIRNILADENIVLGDISIAEPIKIVNTNRYMFPVLNDGKIIKFIELSENEKGGYFISIGNFFANKLNELPNNNYVIFENENGNIFATDGKQQFSLKNNKEDKNTYKIEDFSNEFENNFINTNSNKVIYDINEASIKNKLSLEKSGYWNYQYPEVIQPPNSNACWAACMSSILRGLGMNYSLNDVLNNAGKNENDTSSSKEVIEYFKDYGIYGEIKSQSYPHTENSLREQIRDNGAAIWQAMGGYKGGHAVVIYGYQSTGSSLWVSIMDPAAPDGQARYDCSVDKYGLFSHDGRISTEYIVDLY